jgi:REP element-mobilizing transposase RayT
VAGLAPRATESAVIPYAAVLRYPPKKRIRLPREAYAVPGSVWLVTTTTARRAPHFATPAYAAIAVEELHRQITGRNGRLLLYCVMPDHVHAVIQVGSVDLISLMRSYKAYVSRRCQELGAAVAFWQERFHDRGICRTEQMDELIAYVIENPLKAMLGADWRDYPWTGGELLEDTPPLFDPRSAG